MRPEDFDPTEPPPKPLGEVGSLKKAQESLKILGYTLTAWGPFQVSFFPTAVERDSNGLVPEDKWVHLTPRELAQFLASTKK